MERDVDEEGLWEGGTRQVFGSSYGKYRYHVPVWIPMAPKVTGFFLSSRKSRSDTGGARRRLSPRPELFESPDPEVHRVRQ